MLLMLLVLQWLISPEKKCGKDLRPLANKKTVGLLKQGTKTMVVKLTKIANIV